MGSALVHCRGGIGHPAYVARWVPDKTPEV
jgi:hypothetical protein